MVGNVKKLVASVLDIPSNSIVFKPFNTSCITKDTATLEQYNVHPNNTLHLNEMGLLGGEDDSSVGECLYYDMLCTSYDWSNHYHLTYISSL